MSEFYVRVIEIGEVEKHPNADSLSITSADGYPVILRSGDYATGDKAVYVPIDSIVPGDDERWSFLKDSRRIRAKKLRGVFSMGLLTTADPSWEIGRDVREELRIEKYDPDAARERGANGNTKLPGEHDDTDPGLCPVYDIEGLRKYRGIFVEGEEVWISEKIHGQNARFVHDGERLHCGSRTRFKKPDSPTTWVGVAKRYDLEARLAALPGIAIYGETYGNNTDMAYGVDRNVGDKLVLFDALDTKTRRWFNVDEFLAFASSLGLPAVPTLYRGPWRPDLAALAEGSTTMLGAQHCREGIVVKPVIERHERSIGRCVLKLAGESYLLRKAA